MPEMNFGSLRGARLPGGRSRGGLGGRRRVSLLGVALIVIGAVAVANAYAPGLAAVLRFWPLILVAAGLAGLVRRPGWAGQLDTVLPGTAQLALRPRRVVSWFLIVLGLLLLPLSLHLVDERAVGPALLIALGAYLLWRRSR
ncbi:MAG: LiaF transmembrane domain-containing protein [Candidatus Dormibacteraceae bacterium]